MPSPLDPQLPARLETFLIDCQQQWVDGLSSLEPRATFRCDDLQPSPQHWNRVITCEDGDVLEKMGLNVSILEGTSLPPTASARYPEVAGQPFRAMGISTVIHPRNPMAPTAHANLRFFSVGPKEAQNVWWFGGGFDLTPTYGFEADCVHWHQTAHDLCQPFGTDVYPRFKAACDTYFFLPHRQEARGIGGLFFDDLNTWPATTCFDFLKALGEGFVDQAYRPILEARCHMPYGEAERAWQRLRRGRYVEFNLVVDRGTLFGLQHGSRAESLLVSMPPHADWRYDYQPMPGSREAELLTTFLPPRDWLAKST